MRPGIRCVRLLSALFSLDTSPNVMRLDLWRIRAKLVPDAVGARLPTGCRFVHRWLQARCSECLGRAPVDGSLDHGNPIGNHLGRLGGKTRPLCRWREGLVQLADPLRARFSGPWIAADHDGTGKSHPQPLEVVSSE